LPADATNGFFVAAFLRGEPSANKPVAEIKVSDTSAQKRPREEGADMEVEEVGNQAKAPVRDTRPEIPKTSAQAERARRKKQQQKAKKRKVE
jgi:hypothetical protein